MPLSRYQQAHSFIYNRQHFGIKLGLDNIRHMCELLGNPQDSYHTVHIAGTNGKGSTSSFIAAMLQESGHKVGILTSPHLADYRERIRVNGVKISEDAICEFVETHRRYILKSQVTFFEVTTALAFWYFQQQNVDWAVIEVGLGGRLDATNIITPLVSVITNISLEHTNLLGKTTYKIAGEKGGIIKPNTPVVTGILNNGSPAARRIRQIATEKNAPIHWHRPRGYKYSGNGAGDRIALLHGPFRGLSAPLALAGSHQGQNAYLAVRAIEIIRQLGHRITRDGVRRGLARHAWPGRFMTISKQPTVIIDVAHNQEGFAVLTETLRRHYPGRKFDFLISMVEKKKSDRCLQLVDPLAQSITVVPLQNFRRDDPYFMISRLHPGNGRIRVFPRACDAVKDLLENARPSDILVIAGSHFIMGELAPIIKRDGF